MELTIDKALEQAVKAHKSGDLQKAEALYRAVLQAQPDHADANHNLGVMAVSLDQTGVALPLLKKALELNPSQAQFWISYVDALMKEGHYERAQNVLSQGK
jgi:predicted Zn-dependent protease